MNSAEGEGAERSHSSLSEFETDEAELQPGPVSSKTQKLIVGIGFSLAAAGLFGLADPIGASALILGAIVQPRSRNPGRWLMWVGALLTTIWTGLLSAVFLRETVWTRDLPLPALAFILAPALVLCCDAALAWDTARTRRVREVPAQIQRRNFDWLVWVAAIALSAFYFRNIVPALSAYRLHGWLDILLLNAALSAVVLLFDLTLIVHAFKSRRTREREPR